MAVSKDTIFWHQDLIHHLRSSLLRKLHADCCDARDRLWATYKSFVFRHPYSWLFFYHRYVLIEMSSRNLKWKVDWSIENFRGKLLYHDPNDFFVAQDFKAIDPKKGKLSDKACEFWADSNQWPNDVMKVYPEHNDNFLVQNLKKLEELKERLVNGKTLNEFKMQMSVKGVWA